MAPSTALRYATTQVGTLQSCGGRWGYSTYSPLHRAWWAPYWEPYDQARRNRRAAVVETAVRAMLEDDGLGSDDAASRLAICPEDSASYRRTIDWVRDAYTKATR